MKNRHLLMLLFLVALAAGCDNTRQPLPATAHSVSAAAVAAGVQSVSPAPEYPAAPFSFIPNGGQWDDRALYRLDHAGMRLWFAAGETMIELDGHILRHRFLDAGHYSVRGIGEQQGGWSFFQAAGTTPDLHGFEELRFDEIYPGISGRYYRSNGSLKYELQVLPGADPRRVRFQYDGAGSVGITAEGKLRIETSVGDLLEDAPYVFQNIDGVEHPVPAEFRQSGDGIGFDIGSYDRRYPLTIDPVLIYSSYLGGGGSDSGKGIALDPAGNIYVAGMTRSSDFPTTVGAFSRTLDPRNQSADIFVARFDPTGSTLLYGTYIGGSGIDEPAGIIVRADGWATVAGTTSSTDFPGVSTPLQGATDGFVVTLNPAGTSLRWSRYLGGTGAERIEAIAMHPGGDAVVVGGTNSSDFPVMPGAYETSLRGQEDAFVTRLNDTNGQRVYSTYLGGGQDDHATGVAVERGGAVYLTGWTRSTDFPIPSNSIVPAYSDRNAGGQDGFVARLKFDFSSVDYASYIGGIGNDLPAAIAIDSNRIGGFPSAVITGTTNSTDFPDSMASGPGTWFVSRLPLSSSVIPYSRLIPGGSQGRSIQISSLGEASLAGTTTGARGSDVALVRLSADGRNITGSRSIGGLGSDIPSRQSVLLPTGDLYITGTTFSSDFPTTTGSWDRILNTAGNAATSDAFFLRYNFDPTRAIFARTRRSIATVGCDTIRRDTFHLYNAGDAELEVLALNFVRDSPQLKVASALLPQRIRGGDSFQVVVTFSSPIPTVVQDTLLVTSNDPRLNLLRIAITATRATPGIAALPAMVVFPSRLECASFRDTVINVINNGSGSITLVRPTFTDGAGPFTLAPSQNFPVTIPEGQTRPIRIRLTPRDPGTFRDTLLLRINECGLPLRIPLQATIDSARLRFVERELRFPPLAACASQLDTFVTVINTGSVPLTGFSAPVSSPQFIVTSPLPAQILPGQSATIGIRYTPSSGSVAASLRIDALPCSVSVSLDLFASHSDRQRLEVDASLLDFGLLRACRGELLEGRLRLTLRNRGGSAITLEPGILPAPFELAAALPGMLAPGAELPVEILYRPIVRGADTAEFSIPWFVDGCRDTIRIVLRGNRDEPLLEPERSIMEFPPLGPCEARMVLPLVLFNRSSLPDTVIGARATAGVSIFRPTLPFVIPPGGADTIWVRFEPRQTGQSREELTLFTSQCSDSIPLLILGSKTGGVTTLDEPELLFAPRLACAAPVDSFVVVRHTGGIIQIRSVELAGGGGILSAGPGSGRLLGPDDSLRLPVRFTPGAGSVRGELRVVIEQCGDTLRIPVSAESVSPLLTVEGGAFGAVPVRGSARRYITVRNPLPIPIVIESLQELPLPYRLVQPAPDLPVTIAPGDSVSFEVEFAPLSPGSYNPTVRLVASGGCEFPVTIQLNGDATGTDRVGLCISGDIRGGVGDTVTVSIRADSVQSFPSAGTLTFSIPYDADRLLLTEVRSTAAIQVLDSGYPGGVLLLRQPAVTSIGNVPVVLRFMLLAGGESTTEIRLGSVLLEGVDGVEISACAAVAVIEIFDECLVGGLIRGKYANRLEQASPNPARDLVEITWQQLESSHALLRIFDAAGREVVRPLDRWLPGGRYTVRVDLGELATGGYFYMIEAGEYREAKRLVIAR